MRCYDVDVGWCEYLGPSVANPMVLHGCMFLVIWGCLLPAMGEHTHPADSANPSKVSLTKGCCCQFFWFSGLPLLEDFVKRKIMLVSKKASIRRVNSGNMAYVVHLTRHVSCTLDPEHVSDIYHVCNLLFKQLLSDYYLIACPSGYHGDHGNHCDQLCKWPILVLVNIPHASGGMGVSIVMGYPNSLMVYKGKSHQNG